MHLAWVPASSQDLTPRPQGQHSNPSPSEETDNILQTLQQQSLPELIDSITETKHAKRLTVTQIAGDVKNHEASRYLIQAYAEADAEGVRCKILESMGKFHDPAMFDWLCKRLENPSTSIQCFAIWAIGELKTPRAAGVLQRKLWSPNRFVQMTAIDALGKTGPNPAIASELGPFLGDDDVQFRYLAAKALGGVAGPDMVTELADRLAQEPSLEVQEALAKTLGRTGGPIGISHFVELLKYPSSQATEHWAEVGLAAADPTMVRPALERFLNSDDFRLKVEASRILNEMKKDDR